MENAEQAIAGLVMLGVVVLLATVSSCGLISDRCISEVLPFELALKQKLFDTLELTLSVMMLKAPISFQHISHLGLSWFVCAAV